MNTSNSIPCDMLPDGKIDGVLYAEFEFVFVDQNLA